MHLRNFATKTEYKLFKKKPKFLGRELRALLFQILSGQ